jgi:hypothetical protein
MYIAEKNAPKRGAPVRAGLEDLPAGAQELGLGAGRALGGGVERLEDELARAERRAGLGVQRGAVEDRAEVGRPESARERDLVQVRRHGDRQGGSVYSGPEGSLGACPSYFRFGMIAFPGSRHPQMLCNISTVLDHRTGELWEQIHCTNVILVH